MLASKPNGLELLKNVVLKPEYSGKIRLYVCLVILWLCAAVIVNKLGPLNLACVHSSLAALMETADSTFHARVCSASIHESVRHPYTVIWNRCAMNRLLAFMHVS